MVRILPTIRFGVALAAMLLPALAFGQDRTTMDRLDRIERDLNMLERQIYRGAPTATGAPAPGGAGAADIEVRMQRLEEQMRALTGRVEEVANGLDQLKQRVEQINSDFDVRFNQLSGGTTSASPVPGRPPAPDPNRFAGAPPALVPPGTAVPAPGAPTPLFHTLTPPPGVKPVNPPPEAPPTTPAATLPAGSVNQQFNYAFGLVKQADFPAAEVALRAFIEQHPNDPLAGSAEYWLGETYYQRSKYMEAAAAFAEGYKRFPKGPKAAENLLKLGMALARADQKKNACLAFARLEQEFPANAPLKDRARAEGKHLGC
jgi:tol-pal system protein YbgF